MKRFSALLISGALTLAACGQMADTQLPSNNPPGQGGTAPGQNPGNNNTGSVSLDLNAEAMADIKVTARNATTGQMYQDVSKLPAGTYVLVFTNIKTNVTVEVRVDVQINKTVTVQVPEKVKGDGQQTNTGSLKIDLSAELQKFINVTVKNVNTGTEIAKENYNNLPIGTYVVIFKNIQTNITAQVNVEVKANTTVNVQVPSNVMPVSLQ
ncbi:hypothetical protein [Deinococcus peraridilitoris]|uniref:DUF4382 domain-containing protein n=1 Tax=Deinococcus peraridilitoris (strain DSM 19664 / LMG 22246 / CIP 109416 / KR-200) TaxID=937777 RepID=L0A4P2_DEIPD|nr:hypothetical protein [Deinococcus peraridilitoris]AFZ68409.1 hypothetical protein Deipe_2954 [Deinococcus peraridilitoris DSM 19664]